MWPDFQIILIDHMKYLNPYIIAYALTRRNIILTYSIQKVLSVLKAPTNCEWFQVLALRKDKIINSSS